MFFFVFALPPYCFALQPNFYARVRWSRHNFSLLPCCDAWVQTHLLFFYKNVFILSIVCYRLTIDGRSATFFCKGCFSLVHFTHVTFLRRLTVSGYKIKMHTGNTRRFLCRKAIICLAQEPTVGSEWLPFLLFFHFLRSNEIQVHISQKYNRGSNILTSKPYIYYWSSHARPTREALRTYNLA